MVLPGSFIRTVNREPSPGFIYAFMQCFIVLGSMVNSLFGQTHKKTSQITLKTVKQWPRPLSVLIHEGMARLSWPG